MRLARTRELACMADPYGLEPCPELGASVGWLRGVWWFWVCRGLCPVGRPCLLWVGRGIPGPFLKALEGQLGSFGFLPRKCWDG